MYTMTTPRSFLDEFFRDVDRCAVATPTFQPAADVVEVEGGWRVRLELPGVAKESVKVEMKENVLSVTGEKPDPYAKNESFRQSEVGYGKFTRTFRLSQTIDRDKIEAKFENGVLEIALVPRPEVGSRAIEIR